MHELRHGAVTHFILIRHAEATWSDDENRPLSEAGLRAAARLPERLRGVPIDAIYSSPFRRALETASPLAERLGLRIVEVFELRERALGSPPGASFEEAVAATWSDFDCVHPGGESNRGAQERVVALSRSLASRHPSQTLALSTHGNLLALLLNAFDPRVGFEFWKSLEFPDLIELRLDSSGAGTFSRIEERSV